MILCVSCLIIILTGCQHVEDSNGPDDYSITTFTDEDILKDRERLLREIPYLRYADKYGKGVQT